MITFNQLMTQLLTEGISFYQYSATVRVTYKREGNVGAEKIAELLRAAPGGTRISTVSLDRDRNIAIYNVRLISQKGPLEAYKSFRRNCLRLYSSVITNVEIATGTIETKKFVE